MNSAKRPAPSPAACWTASSRTGATSSTPSRTSSPAARRPPKRARSARSTRIRKRPTRYSPRRRHWPTNRKLLSRKPAPRSGFSGCRKRATRRSPPKRSSRSTGACTSPRSFSPATAPSASSPTGSWKRRQRVKPPKSSSGPTTRCVARWTISAWNTTSSPALSNARPSTALARWSSRSRRAVRKRRSSPASSPSRIWRRLKKSSPGPGACRCKSNSTAPSPKA